MCGNHKLVLYRRLLIQLQCVVGDLRLTCSLKNVYSTGSGAAICICCAVPRYCILGSGCRCGFHFYASNLFPPKAQHNICLHRNDTCSAVCVMCYIFSFFSYCWPKFIMCVPQLRISLQHYYCLHIFFEPNVNTTTRLTYVILEAKLY